MDNVVKLQREKKEEKKMKHGELFNPNGDGGLLAAIRPLQNEMLGIRLKYALAKNQRSIEQLAVDFSKARDVSAVPDIAVYGAEYKRIKGLPADQQDAEMEILKHKYPKTAEILEGMDKEYIDFMNAESDLVLHKVKLSDFPAEVSFDINMLLPIIEEE
jgi:hypothetical protein